ncbi:hypothetical protein, partial [Pseudomonas sp. WS 5407]|uniref:hypothetical protein n=1 Tax=Pseudomonas sp. WS 5407 TaxID=2717496 RepID=UPI001CA42C47
RGSTGWDWRASHNLNLSNRPVRTRMPGGVAGERPMKAVPYADGHHLINLQMKRRNHGVLWLVATVL